MIEDEFWGPYVEWCTAHGVDPIDLLAVAANESGCNPRAYNPGGHAAGLWQLTPAGAPAAGWDSSDMHLFANLGAAEQWPYWARYFAGKGALVNRAACYVATYLPALLSLAGNPDALLAAKDGRTDAPHPERWTKAERESWYTGNASFDRGRTGEIRVRDLTVAIDRACLAMGGVWVDYVARIRKAQGARATTIPDGGDVTDGGRDMPVFAGPSPSGEE